jgi:hypothetical protein
LRFCLLSGELRREYEDNCGGRAKEEFLHTELDAKSLEKIFVHSESQLSKLHH